ncbi:MAG: hypothetical protein E7212_02610 [Clostridium sartagoforme]|nr:hypothetical protein [Clostridium sartagoforme]
MKFMKKSLVILIFSAFIMIFNECNFAEAYTGYAGGDGGLYYASAQARIAKYYLDLMGYSTTEYTGVNYTKSSVSSNVANVGVFYVSCHGSSNASAFWTNQSQSKITSSELYSWTRGFYKFGFIDACHSGETQAMYNALNMSDGDGASHAFLGWNDLSYDNYDYYIFTMYVFEKLAEGYTINDAVWTARQKSGVTNYQIYGDYQMTM